MKLWICMLLIGTAAAAETKITMKDLPDPVRKALAAQSQGAVLRGLIKEIDNGKTEYEAELTVNGHAKDVSFDAEGKVVTVEEEIKLERLPAPARAAIEKAAAGGTLRRVESVSEGGKAFYEASIRKNGKSHEVQVDAAGGVIK